MKVFLALIMACCLFACEGEVEAQASMSSATTLAIETRRGEMQQFNIELALTPQEQAYGLMNRSSMPDDHGMLFVFGDEAERGFWMKNTLIPLDMIFIRRDGIIHHIHENAIPGDLTSVPSRGPAMAVLEVNGGVTKRQGISIGDRVHHPIFKSP